MTSTSTPRCTQQLLITQSETFSTSEWRRHVCSSGCKGYILQAFALALNGSHANRDRSSGCWLVSINYGQCSRKLLFISAAGVAFVLYLQGSNDQHNNLPALDTCAASCWSVGSVLQAWKLNYIKWVTNILKLQTWLGHWGTEVLEHGPSLPLSPYFFHQWVIPTFPEILLKFF